MRIRRSTVHKVFGCVLPLLGLAVGVAAPLSAQLAESATTLKTQSLRAGVVGSNIGFAPLLPPVAPWQATSLAEPPERSAPMIGIGRPLTGAVIGGPLAVVAGGILGQMIGPRDVSDDCMFACIGSGPMVGMMLGAVLGPGIGAHLLNDRRGDPWMTMAGSLLGAAAGIGLGYLAGDAAGSPAVGFAIGIPLVIGVPALAELASARQRR